MFASPCLTATLSGSLPCAKFGVRQTIWSISEVKRGGGDLKAGREEMEDTLSAEASLFGQLNHITELYLWSN